ncbi:MAG: CHAD domain-containing protein [Myxococcales bacterium]|nr:CHAD domain-containing protein [Myxococcales bacterium]USN50799.1 MAG: CHAD domain-containing protein [Myxococcales bacterium]
MDQNQAIRNFVWPMQQCLKDIKDFAELLEESKGHAKNLHCIRISLRKLYVLIEMQTDIFPEIAHYKNITHELKKLRSELSIVRDWDVFKQMLFPVPILTLSKKKWYKKIEDDINQIYLKEYDRIRKIFDEKYSENILKKISGLIESLTIFYRARNIDRAIKDACRRILEQDRTTLIKFLDKSRSLWGLSTEQQHKLRIISKNYLYKLKFLRNIFGKKIKKEIKNMKKIQDILSEVRDFCMAKKKAQLLLDNENNCHYFLLVGEIMGRKGALLDGLDRKFFEKWKEFIHLHLPS